jgi:hypothetical protein
MTKLEELKYCLLIQCGFGPIFMVIGAAQSYVHEAGESWWITFGLPLMPIFGALMVSFAISSFVSTTRRQTQEIELLRKQLEVLKAGKSWEQSVVDLAQLATQEAQEAERLATQRRLRMQIVLPMTVFVFLLTVLLIVFVVSR